MWKLANKAISSGIRQRSSIYALNLLPSASATHQTQQQFGSIFAQQKFHFSSNEGGSHSDFEPKSNQNSSAEVTEHISKWIEENDVCVFMKGSRKMPQCGFSRYVCVLFNAYGVKTMKDVNVLADDTLR